MSFLTPGIVNVVGQGAALANTPGLLSELTGQSTRVQFLRQGVGVIFVFDSCINESHTREVQPSQFPIEDGGIISDNLMVTPFEISLTGMVSDTPIYNEKERLLQTLGQAATTLVPPLGIAVASAAQKLYSISQGASSPSKEAYQTLVKIQAGDPYASPPQPPEPFTLVTQYKRYPDCIIRALKFDRDSSTASTCVFSMSIVQLRRIAPQSVRISILKNPGLAASKQELGEQEPNRLTAAYKQGSTDGTTFEEEKVGVLKSIGKSVGIGG